MPIVQYMCSMSMRLAVVFKEWDSSVDVKLLYALNLMSFLYDLKFTMIFKYGVSAYKLQ